MGHGQPCDYKQNPELIGKMVELLPTIMDFDYPYVCTPGVLGGADESEQVNSVCARLCPERYYCPHRPTLKAIICKAGSYCPEGSPVPLPCEPGTWSNITGLMSQDECSICPPGHFCTGGSKFECGVNTYQPFERQDQQTDCVRCPDRSTTLNIKGVSKYSQCVCGENLYRASREHAEGLDSTGHLLDDSYAEGRPACQDSAGVVRLDLTELCCVCPVGTDCSAGAVPLEALPLRRGYYRLSDDSSDVRRCPDAAANCSYANQCPESTSGCFGGADIASVCRPTLTGIFCTQCEPDPGHKEYKVNDTWYYVEATTSEGAHCLPCAAVIDRAFSAEGNMVALYLLIGAILIVLIGIGCALKMPPHMHARRRRVQKRLAMVGHSMARKYTLPNKVREYIEPFPSLEQLILMGLHIHPTHTPYQLKILIGFYMIAAKVEKVYDLYFPAEVRTLLNTFKVWFSFGMEGIPLECVGAVGYEKKLQMWVAIPPIVAAMTFGGAWAYIALTRARDIAAEQRLKKRSAKRKQKTALAPSKSLLPPTPPPSPPAADDGKKKKVATHGTVARVPSSLPLPSKQRKPAKAEVPVDNPWWSGWLGGGKVEEAEEEVTLTRMERAQQKLAGMIALVINSIVGRTAIAAAKMIAALVRRVANSKVGRAIGRVLPEQQTCIEILELAAPLVLRMLFLIYPIITTIAFEAFSCHHFEGGAAYLAADVTVQCYTDDHYRIRSLAWFAVSVYAIGFIVVVFLLLYTARHAIIDKRPTRLSRALSFLHREYDPAFYFWECCEMTRRFLLVGLFVVAPYQRGSLMQLAVGLLFATIYLLIQQHAKPFINLTDDCECYRIPTRALALLIRALGLALSLK